MASKPHRLPVSWCSFKNAVNFCTLFFLYIANILRSFFLWFSWRCLQTVDVCKRMMGLSLPFRSIYHFWWWCTDAEWGLFFHYSVWCLLEHQYFQPREFSLGPGGNALHILVYHDFLLRMDAEFYQIIPHTCDTIFILLLDSHPGVISFLLPLPMSLVA